MSLKRSCVTLDAAIGEAPYHKRLCASTHGVPGALQPQCHDLTAPAGLPGASHEVVQWLQALARSHNAAAALTEANLNDQTWCGWADMGEGVAGEVIGHSHVVVAENEGRGSTLTVCHNGPSATQFGSCAAGQMCTPPPWMHWQIRACSQVGWCLLHAFKNNRLRCMLSDGPA
eukprot:358772-Chlamydomonas_euryale.AAC.19